MSPLQKFMQKLLEHHCGCEIHLVVDNAALTSERSSSSAPLTNGSGHSCSRWETQEPSPTRNAEKVANVPGITSPSFQLRPLAVVSKNSSPACPIRKLSPRVHPDMEIRSEKIKSTCRNPTEVKKPLKGVERLAISRPPLSPRKKSVLATAPQGNNKTHHAMTSVRAQALQPPVRAIMKPTAPPEELLNLADLEAPWIDDEEKLAAEMPAGLTRGLSQTLGADLKEQAPICPTRRPSTQSNDLPATTLPNKHTDRTHYLRVGREIVVLPPTPEMRVDVVASQASDDRERNGTDRTHESTISCSRNTSDGPSSLRGTTGCGPIFVQRRR